MATVTTMAQVPLSHVYPGRDSCPLPPSRVGGRLSLYTDDDAGCTVAIAAARCFAPQFWAQGSLTYAAFFVSHLCLSATAGLAISQHWPAAAAMPLPPSRVAKK